MSNILLISFALLVLVPLQVALFSWANPVKTFYICIRIYFYLISLPFIFIGRFFVSSLKVEQEIQEIQIEKTKDECLQHLVAIYISLFIKYAAYDYEDNILIFREKGDLFKVIEPMVKRNYSMFKRTEKRERSKFRESVQNEVFMSTLLKAGHLVLPDE